MKKLCLAFASVLTLLVAPSLVSANHFRSGTMSWSTVSGEEKTVLVKAQVVWTNTHGHIPSTTPIGGVLTSRLTIYWGDGSSTPAAMRVISRDEDANDVFTEIVSDLDDDDVYETVGLKHTYAADGDYTAYWGSSAREGANAQTSGTWRNETLINIGNDNNGPVSAVPAIIQVPDNTEFSYQLSAADSDGDDIRFRLGTQDEFYNNGNDDPVTPPTGLTLSEDGLIEWDVQDGTLDTDIGDRWQMTVMVEDLDGEGAVKSKSPLDFVLLISDSSNTPPVFTSTPGGTQTVAPGETLNFTMVANDPDWEVAQDSPSTQALNPPSTDGDVWSEDLTQTDDDASLAVSFTPEEGMIGNSYVVIFRVTDQGGATAVANVTIQVTEETEAPAPAPTPQPTTSSSGGGSGKAKTLRWRGMKRGELMNTNVRVDKHNYEEYYAKSKEQIAKMNAGIAPTQKYVVNRWGEHVFAGYLAGRIGLERYPHRYQNIVRFGSGSLTKGRGIELQDEELMLASAPESIEDIIIREPSNQGWADEYQLAKDRFQRPEESDDLFASAPVPVEKVALETDQVETHKNQRDYYRKKGIVDRKRDTSMVKSSRMDATKDMDTVQIRFGGKSVPMSNYLRNLQNNLFGNLDGQNDTSSTALVTLLITFLAILGGAMYWNLKRTKKSNSQ